MSTDFNVKATSGEAPSIYAIQQGSAYLKVGDVGEAVLVCRELLNKKGYACDTTSETYDTTLKSIESAGWFWDVFKDLNSKITQWTSLSADETVTKVTKVVNGGTNGLQARKNAYAKSKTIFK